MPPDSAAPSPVAPIHPRAPMSDLEFFTRLFTIGTAACTCGAPRCPGTLARAAATPAAPVMATVAPVYTPEDPTRIFAKRLEFVVALSKLINRLSLEAHFGNLSDHKLAGMAWEFLANPRPDVGQTGNAASSAFIGKPPEPGNAVSVSQESPRVPNLDRPTETTASPKEPTRHELIATMHDAATKLGYRISDLVKFS